MSSRKDQSKWGETQKTHIYKSWEDTNIQRAATEEIMCVLQCRGQEIMKVQKTDLYSELRKAFKCKDGESPQAIAKAEQYI